MKNKVMHTTIEYRILAKIGSGRIHYRPEVRYHRVYNRWLFKNKSSKWQPLSKVGPYSLSTNLGYSWDIDRSNVETIINNDIDRLLRNTPYRLDILVPHQSFIFRRV